MRRAGWRIGLWKTLALPAYWPLATFAAFKALVEAVAAPSYWDKTGHGAGPAVEGAAGIRRSGPLRAGAGPSPMARRLAQAWAQHAVGWARGLQARMDGVRWDGQTRWLTLWHRLAMARGRGCRR